MKRALLFKSCSKYWPQAQLAINSARAHNPTYNIHVVTDGLYQPGEHWAQDGIATYGSIWLSTATPGGMLRLLEQGYESVFFVDSDTYTFGPYIEAQAELDSGASILVSPHIMGPLPLTDDLEPSIEQIARMGNYNAGFVGATQAGIPFLKFWLEASKKFAYQDASKCIAGEQTGLRYALDFDSNARILRHPGYNWAYWNAAQRPLSYGGAELRDIYAGGLPLRMAHFSGLTADMNPNKMSRYQNRVRLQPESIEYQLFAEYQSHLTPRLSL